jgi:hypothetical protein
MSWVFTYQDYSRHQFGDPRPHIERQCFRTQAEAEAALRTHRTTNPDCNTNVASVTETGRRRPPVAVRQGDFGFLADGPRRMTD